MNEINEIIALTNLSLRNRIDYQSKQVRNQKKSDRSQEASAKIISYNAPTGMYTVVDVAGTIRYAKPISNSSALHIGAYVSLVFETDGIPIIDAMPR